VNVINKEVVMMFSGYLRGFFRDLFRIQRGRENRELHANKNVKA
jgi:hypothetical protein